MLKQRIITALVMLTVLLPALFASDSGLFMGLTMLLIAAGAWEWGRMNGVSTWVAWLGAGICWLLCMGAMQSGWVQHAPASVWWLSGLLWVLLGAWMIRRGVAGWLRWPQGLRWTVGLCLLALAWLAMAQAHHRGISPGKSWEGVLGGMFGVLLVAVVWAQQGGWVAIPALLFMSTMSVVVRVCCLVTAAYSTVWMPCCRPCLWP
eukprot:gene22878-29055_t